MNKKTDKYTQTISYCIPVMNRLSDIKITLKHNINTIKCVGERCSIIIACFDKTDDCEQWIKANFSNELASGLLRFIRRPPLPYWHFSWAKNAFKDTIQSEYYSSLDGDNFLSKEDVRRTLEVIDRYKDGIVIHHFSGSWGDGTSGRITVPTYLYRRYGYMNDLLPRQFDEMSLLLNILSQEPKVSFVSHKGVNIFESSKSCGNFLDFNKLSIKHKYEDLALPKSPLNPRGETYVKEHRDLDLFQDLNIAYSLTKISREEKAVDYFSKQLKTKQREFLDSEEINSHSKFFFKQKSLEGLKMSSEITLYAVIKDDFHFLPNLYEHYKNLGVERFIIIDNDSSEPLEKHLPFKNVFIVKPRIGDFKNFKSFWIMALMKWYQVPGSWVLTVDSDEFIDIPYSNDDPNPLKSLVHQLNEISADWLPGILVDMMPNDTARDISVSNFIEEMNTVYVRPYIRADKSSREYSHHKSIKWAFGDFWQLSLYFDLRWRFFRTIDCLRKYPIFRYSNDVAINQGFHTIKLRGTEPDAKKTWGEGSMILPIRHYKMYKLFSNDFDVKKYRDSFDAYFGRTRENLEQIFADSNKYLNYEWNLTPFKVAYSGADSFAGWIQSIRKESMLTDDEGRNQIHLKE